MGEPLRWALAPAGATASSNRGPGTAGPLLANPLLPPHPTPWLRSGEPPVIKICDFGFAKTWSEEANMFTQIGWAGAGAGRAGKQPQSPRSVRLGMGQERAPTRASPLCRAVQHPRVHEPRADQQQERQGASAMRWRACRCSFLLHTTDLSSLGLPPSPARAPSPPMCQPCLPLSSTANAYPPPPTPPQTHTHTRTHAHTRTVPARPVLQIGYDGRSVDVWASGILLLVMLLGSFPFDHTGARRPLHPRSASGTRDAWPGPSRLPVSRCRVPRCLAVGLQTWLACA